MRTPPGDVLVISRQALDLPGETIGLLNAGQDHRGRRGKASPRVVCPSSHQGTMGLFYANYANLSLPLSFSLSLWSDPRDWMDARASGVLSSDD